MSSSNNKSAQHNTNHTALKVDALPCGPPQYRPPPQPQPSKSQNYIYARNECTSPTINTEEYNQFHAINDVNRFVFQPVSFKCLLICISNFELRRYKIVFLRSVSV